MSAFADYDPFQRPPRPFRRLVARVLRWLLERLGEESDTDLRARVVALYRRSEVAGSRVAIERAIWESLPLGVQPEFRWDSPVCTGDTLRLWVNFR